MKDMLDTNFYVALVGYYLIPSPGSVGPGELGGEGDISSLPPPPPGSVPQLLVPETVANVVAGSNGL